MSTKEQEKWVFSATDEGLLPTDEKYAELLDRNDPLRDLRHEFWIPQKKALKRTTRDLSQQEDDACTYLVGNGIGLQPRCLSTFVQDFLDRWATQGVFAGFAPIADSKAPSWAELEGQATNSMARLIGAKTDETVLMAGLTINLHLLMASFYRPSALRTKIIMEKEAFATDLFAVQSQLQWHGLDVAENLVLIESDPLIPLERVQQVLDEHESSTAVLLLSGVQYLTGQFLDIESITKYAHGKGVLVIWDLAHAVGNVELKLHQWDVDIAVWCSYKYLNAGPGTIGGAFIHEKHAKVDAATNVNGYRPRLAGWWGQPAIERFKMEHVFQPDPGAAGFQVSSVPIFDLTIILGSLSVFEKTTMLEISEKSGKLTKYLEFLLKANLPSNEMGQLVDIITPSSVKERGAQMSLSVKVELLNGIMSDMEEAKIIVDVRKPNIMRITPVALYNTYREVHYFVSVLTRAIKRQLEG